MNLFSDIEGMRGEELTSAVLRHLLLRSSVVREVLIKIISEKSKQGPLSMESRFACTREETTEDEAKNRGRLDLLLETDDAVIGIENKIFASWQSDQPIKYLDRLRERAELLQKMTGREVRHLLTVLIPKSRVEDDVVQNKVLVSEHCVLITWEDVLDELRNQASSLDPLSASIMQSLNQFVLSRIGFMPDFKNWINHFRLKWVSKGNPYQRQLVVSIREFFPDPGPRLGATNTWIGYYFASDLGANRAWYGFVPRSILRVKGGGNALPAMRDHQAELVVATTFPVDFSSGHFLSVNGKDILGSNKEVFGWVVAFDKQWEAPGKWVSELKPLFGEVNKLKAKTTDVGQ